MKFANQPQSWAREEFDVAELVFDSDQHSPAAGVRGSATIARQLVYRVGSICIDMCMQPKPGSDAMVLIGQLLDSKHPDHGIGDIPVHLLCEGGMISRKRTNTVGEFEFGIESPQALQLSFGIAGRRKLIVPLPSTKDNSQLVA